LENSKKYNLEQHGFGFLEKIFTDKETDHCKKSLEKIINGFYETGKPPENRFWEIGDDEHSIIKIDKPHLCDQNVWNFITNKSFGLALSNLTKSKKIKIWHSQLVWKPTSKGSSGNAGWHRDAQYWPFWSEKGLYTAWIALTDVRSSSGPVKYICNSNRWDKIDGLDFFKKDLKNQNRILTKNKSTFNVVDSILNKGQVSVHKSLTYHSSGSNRDLNPRVGLVVHFCNENSRRVSVKGENKNYLNYLQDEIFAPVIYEK
jgi:hypothetical protein